MFKTVHQILWIELNKTITLHTSSDQFHLPPIRIIFRIIPFRLVSCGFSALRTADFPSSKMRNIRIVTAVLPRSPCHGDHYDLIRTADADTPFSDQPHSFQLPENFRRLIMPTARPIHDFVQREDNSRFALLVNIPGPVPRGKACSIHHQSIDQLRFRH